MRRILFQETDFGTLPNPPAGFKYIGFDGPNFTEKDENGQSRPTGGGNGLIDITYSEIVYAIDENELTPGSYYRITDFRTCYDQPDYNISKGTITQGTYRTTSVHPIIVFATSVDTLAPDAYQPDYPNDTIKYDVTYSSTYTSGGTAYGRIIERIDEYNNRTDYDHRDILFKRYKGFYHEFDSLRGNIQLDTNGIVSGVDTYFEDDFNVGDFIAIPETNQYVYQITEITSSLTMSVTGSSIPNYSGNYRRGFRIGTENSSYISYFPNNVDGQDDYLERKTFPDNETKLNNYIGNFYNLAIDWDEETFDLPNSVFGEDCINNIIGNGFKNNTFDSDVEENIIGHYFRNNIIVTDSNDFDDNKIGNFFENNIILEDFNNNNIEDSFQYNYILGQFENNNIGDNINGNEINSNFFDNTIGSDFDNNTIWSNFRDNIIGNDCRNNNIYSEFYDNQIGNNFYDNTIGDNGNLDNFEFYRNRIGNDFNDNTIRQDFQNNQIGNQFNNNTTNGNFYKNVIGNGFNNNGNIGHDFYGNYIGNGFHDNDYIGDYFQNNKIGEYFQDNLYIYNNFKDNSIGNQFENNTLGDIQYFNWDNTNIENLTARNYNSFYNALYGDDGENIGNVILGKELIMHFTRNPGTVINSGDLIIGETYEITNYLGTDDFTDIANVQSGNINTNGCVFVATGSTVSNWSSQSELTELTSYDEYHLVKFTQWTQNSNGGGFSYERTKIWADGNTISEPTVYFTKINYKPKVDVIIEGRLEITRGNNQAIYNAAAENGWSNNTPYGTQWNSIYTQGYFSFENNDIQNGFKGNYILEGFSANSIGYGFAYNELSAEFSSNITSTLFHDNNFYGSVYSNEIGNDFYSNNIGDGFSDNNIGGDFSNNNILSNFRHNKIGKYFSNNTIAEDFGFGGNQSEGNIIGDYFQSNTIGEYFYNNKVASYFENNTVGYYFQRNNIDTKIYDEDFIVNYGNILALTYTSSGTTSTDNYYTVIGNTNGHGTNSTFGVTVSGGTISSFSLINAGNQYEVGDTITIPGNIIGGQIGVISSFDASNGLGKNGTDGSYFDVTVTGGSGSNATFNIDVTSGTVSNISLSNGGGSYLIGNTLSVSGSEFGGTNSVDDFIITVNSLYSDNINITVTAVSATPSVYDSYNCQIFERKGGNIRLSFYDENDILTIKNINE
jgi:hypothetical protein